jgi:hypothetical protein
LTAQLIRSYKGAAASIILLFMIEQRPLSQQYMRRYSGYGDEPVSDAVGLLRDSGFLVQTGRYTWALLTDGLRQLPIMAQDAEPEALPPFEPVDNPVENSSVFRNSAPEKTELAPHVCMNESDSENDDDDEPTCMHGAAPEKTELEQALEDAGFYGSGLERLLVQPGLTARVVRYHVEHAPSLGAALTRIEQRWKVPKSWEPSEPSTPDGARERKKRYGGGQYADFVQT